MKITRVNTDRFYKKKYVYLNNNILDIETAIEIFPKKKYKILKKSLDYKPAKEAIQANYIPFPSSNKIVETLLERRQHIYNELNLNKIIGKDADIVKALILFDYLSTNAFYDMTSIEEVEAVENTTNRLSKKLDYSLEEYIRLKNEFKKAQTKEEKQQIKKQMLKAAKIQAELNEQYVEKDTKQQNRTYLKKLYNVLMRHKGVCDEFSYVYQFLLQGQNINSFHTSIYKEGDTFSHAVNLVEYKKDKERGYFIVDVTKGVATALKYPKDFFHTQAFAIPKNDFLDVEAGYNITVLQSVNQIKQDAQEDFCVIIDMKEHLDLVEGKILESGVFKTEIKKAWQFIASDYQKYEEEKDQLDIK